MTNITVIAAHPDPEKSLANRTILEKLGKLLPHADIVRLAVLYPDWRFDVEKEQARLVQSDMIIFEFPIWWYAIPWLLQKYITEVFTADFAYDAKYALEGKRLILSFTCGGGEKSYTREGLYNLTIDEIMLPVYATAKYCKMDYTGNVISYHMMPEDCPVDEIKEKAREHAERLAKMVQGRPGLSERPAVFEHAGLPKVSF